MKFKDYMWLYVIPLIFVIAFLGLLYTLFWSFSSEINNFILDGITILSNADSGETVAKYQYWKNVDSILGGLAFLTLNLCLICWKGAIAALVMRFWGVPIREKQKLASEKWYEHKGRPLQIGDRVYWMNGKMKLTVSKVHLLGRKYSCICEDGCVWEGLYADELKPIARLNQ